MLLFNKKCPNCNSYYDATLKKCPHCYKNNELYMNRQISDKIAFLHPFAQIGLFLVGFAYAGMIIAEFICAFFLANFVSGDELYKKTILLFLAYSMMFGGLLTIVLTTRKKEFFSKYRRLLDYLYGIAYAVTIVFASMMVSSLINIFHPIADNSNQTTAVEIANSYPTIALIVLGFLGPVCEEFTYRVGLYSFFRRINKYLAFVITIIVFAFIHFDFEAIGTPNIVEELWALPSYLVSGLILTLAYEHRGPACSMTAHVAYNIFAFSMMLLPK